MLLGLLIWIGGTAAGAFYTYFTSKKQLLVALMNELLVRLNSVKLPDAGGRAALPRFLAGVFRADLANYGVIRAWQEASLSDPELAASFKRCGSIRGLARTWTCRRSPA